jgi:hypothetical protein
VLVTPPRQHKTAKETAVAAGALFEAVPEVDGEA